MILARLRDDGVEPERTLEQTDRRAEKTDTDGNFGGRAVWKDGGTIHTAPAPTELFMSFVFRGQAPCLEDVSVFHSEASVLQHIAFVSFTLREIKM